MGVGKDVHTKHLDWKVSKKLHELEIETTAKEEAGTSAMSEEFDHAQLEDSYCTTTVSVYPTPQMEATFTSNKLDHLLDSSRWHLFLHPTSVLLL
jgi:hypothetical protein